MAAVLAEFVTPYTLDQHHVEYIFVPPRRICMLGRGPLGCILQVDQQNRIDKATLRRVYTPTGERFPIRLLGRGPEYRIPAVEPHSDGPPLFSVADGDVVFLLGTDRMGRDMFSRIVYGARVSLTIGLLGVYSSPVVSLAMGASPVTSAAQRTWPCSASSK